MHELDFEDVMGDQKCAEKSEHIHGIFEDVCNKMKLAEEGYNGR